MQQKVIFAEDALKGVIQNLFLLENNLHQLTQTISNDKKVILKLFDTKTLINQYVNKNLSLDNQSIETNPGKTQFSKQNYSNEFEEQIKNSKRNQKLEKIRKYIELETLKNIEEAKQFNEQSFDENLTHNNIEKKERKDKREKKEKKEQNQLKEQKEQKEQKEKKKKKSKKDEKKKKNFKDYCSKNQLNQNQCDFQIDKRKVIVLEDYETIDSNRVSPSYKQFEANTSNETNCQNDQQQYSQSIVIDLDDFTICENKLEKQQKKKKVEYEISDKIIDIDKQEQKKKTPILSLDDPINTRCKFCEKVMRIKSMKVHLEKIHQGQGLEDWKNRKIN